MAVKRLVFTSKWTTAWHHSVVHALLNTHLPSFDCLIAMKEQRPSSETPAWRSGDRPELSGRSSRKQSKTAQRRPFLDTKLAVEQARPLKTQQHLLVAMHVCFPVVLSFLDASFEPRCGRKIFFSACYCCCCLLLLLLLLLLAKTCCSPLAPKRWCKTSTG